MTYNAEKNKYNTNLEVTNSEVWHLFKEWCIQQGREKIMKNLDMTIVVRELKKAGLLAKLNLPSGYQQKKMCSISGSKNNAFVFVPISVDENGNLNLDGNEVAQGSIEEYYAKQQQDKSKDKPEDDGGQSIKPEPEPIKPDDSGTAVVVAVEEIYDRPESSLDIEDISCQTEEWYEAESIRLYEEQLEAQRNSTMSTAECMEIMNLLIMGNDKMTNKEVSLMDAIADSEVKERVNQIDKAAQKKEDANDVIGDYIPQPTPTVS